MFEKAAYEGYSGRKLYDWLKNETNFRSRGGYVLGLSNIYKILNNPYYCGLFSFSGKWYKGSYEPIITREIFDAVQKKMITAPKSKPGTKQFDFTRLFKCGGCGSGITAQERIKRLKSAGEPLQRASQQRHFPTGGEGGLPAGRDSVTCSRLLASQSTPPHSPLLVAAFESVLQSTGIK